MVLRVDRQTKDSIVLSATSNDRIRESQFQNLESTACGAGSRQRSRRPLWLWVGAVAVALSQVSCASTYYRTLETFGVEKREILANRIENARDSQEDAKDQFVSALEQYRSVVHVDGGDLEEIYDRLNKEYERSVDRADEVGERIEAVQSVADDLFDEWGEEIEQYSDPSLSDRSQRLLSDTQRDYRRVLDAMQRAERSMEPVLTLFNDQVLILRHNLNAQAIGSLESELATIESATTQLIREMERAIDEASRFVAGMA